jgi:hypothetical protein
MSAVESCPVCFGDDVAIRKLKGCGHSICVGCKNNLKKTSNQHILNNFNQTLVKCPMCRAIEKPSYQQLEQQVQRLLDEIAYKNRRIVQLCDGRLASVVPPTPHVPVIDLVGPRPATPGQVVAVMGLARAPPAQRTRTRARANTNIPLMFCQRTDCRRKIRTRDRCRNHPDTPCCQSCRWAGCNTCRAEMRNRVPAANPGPPANPIPATGN